MGFNNNRTGRYFKKNPETGISALAEILDENLKTIIHIPNNTRTGRCFKKSIRKYIYPI